MAIKPIPVDFEELKMKYHDVWEIEDLAKILTWYQLQDAEYETKHEYESKYKNYKKSILQILENLVTKKILTIDEKKIEHTEDWDEVLGDGPIIVTTTIRQIILSEFADWAIKEVDFKCPQVILDMATEDPSNNEVVKNQDSVGNNQNMTESAGKKTVTPATDNRKTVDALLKIVIAMAIDCYGYNPENEEKSTTITDIMNALAKCGLSVSENTIRTRLKQAQEFLPRDQE